MSFIYRDFLSPSVFNFNTNSRLYHRFRKAWPRIVINDIECYDKQYRWFQGGTIRSAAVDKSFYNVMGTSYQELSDNKPSSDDEIEYMYFELISSKYNYGAPTRADIVEFINTQMCKTQYDGNCTEYLDSITVNIDYGGALRKYAVEHSIGFEVIESPDGDPTKATLLVTPFNADVIRNLLHSDPWFYFANIATYSDNARTIPFDHLSASENTGLNTYYKALTQTPVTSVSSSELVGAFAVLDNGANFVPMVQIDGRTFFNDEQYTVTTGLEPCETDCDGDPIYTSTKGEVLGYRYSIEYAFTPVDENSYIVGEIFRVAEEIERAAAERFDKYSRLAAADTLPKKAIFAIDDIDKTDEVWEDGYLKVDAVANLKRWEFADLFSKTFNNGYKVEDAEWWEKALGIIIVIVAIVIGVVVAVFCTVCAAAAYPGLAAAAAGFAAGGLALSLGSLVLALVGGPSAMRIVKQIGDFAQIVGYIAMILGIFNWITNTFQAYARQWAAKEIQDAAQYTVTQFVKDVAADMFDSVITSVLDTWSFLGDMFTGNFSTSPIQLSDVSGFIDNMRTGFKYYNEFFGEKPIVDDTLEEQTTKSNQFPEDMYATMDMVIYEPDALQKMDILKERDLGGNMTQSFLDSIA